MATDPGLALHKLAGQPLPQLPLVSSSASRPKAFLAPSLPSAHRAVWKTESEQPQEGDAGADPWAALEV